MNVNPIFQPHAAASNPTTSSDTTGTTNDMFLQLLTTQLKNQSPLDPVDPNQFVNQMVQLNTLNQIVSIRQLLDLRRVQQINAQNAIVIRDTPDRVLLAGARLL